MKYRFSKDESIEIVITDEPEQQFGMHVHAGHFVFTLVLAGTAELTSADEQCAHTVTFTKGETFTIMPFTAHSVKKAEDAKLLSVCIAEDRIYAPADRAAEVSAEISAEVQALLGQIPLGQPEQQGLTQAIHAVLNAPPKKTSLTKDVEQTVSRIIQNVRDGAQETLALETLSGECRKSKFHFLRKFRSGVGMTPHQFEIQVKVRNAQKDIRSGKSLTDAAQDNGFYDASHFTKSFRKITGTRPSDYGTSVEKPDSESD